VRPLLKIYYGFSHLVRELLKFGVIGAIAYVVDIGVFNLVYLWTDGDKPLTAKTVSVVAATTVAYFGNRHWTFRHRGRSGLRREYLLFFVLNGVGLAIALTCLFVSHYLLGFESALADNISANGVGLVLGTMFRFWSYRRWVFPAALDEEAAAELEAEGASGALRKSAKTAGA
jgi:putative flippase GtrA